MIATGIWGECEWLISDTGVLRIGGGVAESVSADGKYPWDAYRDEIRRIAFDGEVTGIVSLIGAFMNCSQLEEIDLRGLDTSNTVDMSWLLCGCSRLKSIDLSVLDTGKVVDMSCMFLSCRGLEQVEFGSIDTSSVMDMSKMFMYCSSLKSLDLSTQDNRALQMADDMFFGCDGLRALAPGKDFSLGGNGRTVIAMPESKEMLLEEKKDEPAADQMTEEAEMQAVQSVSTSDWRTSTDGVLYIAGTEFVMRYDGNGAVPLSRKPQKDPAEDVEMFCTAGTQLRAGRDLYEVPDGLVFKEWNTRKDGSGRTILPGQLYNVHYDMTLYAIWAGTPVFRTVYDIPPIEYGQLLDLPEPDVDPRNGEITSLKAQISWYGESSWADFANEEPLPVNRSNARIRYVAENFVGTSVSEERPIRIDKASYNMEETHWVLPEDLTYDGQEKEVHLEGLPEGVSAEYAGNTATAVGEYTASAILIGDADNYLPPQPVEDLKWAIPKGKYQMSDLNWTYMEAFTYDGQPKSIRLEGLPEGTVPYYSGADAVDAGTYIATAGLDYDIDNYSRPDPVKPCTWKILKTNLDMSDVHWEGPGVFIYDGSPKKVELGGLPEGVHAEYTGNIGTEAGQYKAKAAFVVDDSVNYEIPESVEFTWEIHKADHDLSGIAWTESSLLYDGEEQSIRLTGIPEGVSVLYEGDTATQAGHYTVRAEFCVEDLNNYNQIEPITENWEIRRRDIDMSDTRWNYSSPYVYNGAEKTVELKDLPPEIEEVTYTGERGVEVGSYTARANFTYDRVNYNPPVIEDCHWDILKGNLKLQDMAWDYDSSFVYDGGSHTVRLTGLPENALVSYENDSAVAAGTYTTVARITPTDLKSYNIPEPVELTWNIRKAVFDISGAVWNEKAERIFDGSVKSIAMSGLPEGVHVSYEGNEATDAGEYMAKAVFSVDDTDNFVPPQPKKVIWSIAPAAIDLTGVYWDYREPYTYDGSEKKIRLAGLPEGVEARYTGNIASEAGEHLAKAVLLPPEDSSFRETEVLSKVWRINKAQIDVSGVSWSSPDQMVYDRMLKEVKLEGLPENVRVEYTGNKAVDAGSYRAEAILTPYDEDNYEAPKISGFSWSISRADIDMSEVEWSGCETFVYDGTVHRVVLRYLPAILDAVYEGNSAVDAGNYVALAEFRPKDQRNYNTPRRMQYEWSVAKAELDASGVRWVLNGDDLIYDGKEHGIWLTGVPENATPSYQGNTAVDAGQYIASAVLEPEDELNYLPCVIEPCRWEIEKAEIDISNVMWASSGELVYDGTRKVVGLTGLAEDVSVEYENNVAVDAGTYHASAVLSTQNNNYIAPEIESCTWTIAKAVPDISGISWSYAFDFIYDGYEKSVELIGVPEDMTAMYRGNAAIEAGEYEAEATLVMDDPLNYEVVKAPPLQWKIAKRDYDMSGVAWTGAEDFVYDGTAKSVEITGLEDGLEPIYQDNVAVEAGVYTARARFLYDENNYNPPAEQSFTWQIRKAPMDVSGAGWNYEGPFRADGKTHTVTLKADTPDPGLVGRMFSKNKEIRFLGLPEGTTVRYEGNTARAAGVYEAKAYLNVPPQSNYEVSGPICLTWEITDD